MPTTEHAHLICDLRLPRPSNADGVGPRFAIAAGDLPRALDTRTLPLEEFTMALPDLEKRALPSLENGHGYEFDEEPPRRRALSWLGTFAVVLSLLATVWWTSGQGLAATLSFTNHASLQAHTGYPGLASQAVISRSPTVDVGVDDDTGTGTTSAAAPTRTVLKVFEVDQPVLMPGGPAESDGSTRAGEDYSPELCTVLLMRHDFAWSYNAPFVGKLGPHFFF
jgi:hypothetical protein